MPSVNNSQLFTRFVEPGRLALITYGPCEGKMATVIDIVDQKRVIVDGPSDVTGVHRHMMPVRRLSLTDFKSKIPRGARVKSLKRGLKEGDTLNKFKASSWGKKLSAREARKNLTDFERFQVMVAKTKRNKAARASLKKGGAKAVTKKGKK